MFDLIITGGTVVDGTGAPGIPADVAVKDGRITAVVPRGADGAGGIDPGRSAHHIAATGRIVAPGFIDLHQHGDYTIHGAPEAPSQIAQGVTTILTGNCGASPFPARSLADSAAAAGHMTPVFAADCPDPAGFLEATAELEPEVSIAFQVGFSSIRQQVMGDARRPASADEIAAMQNLIAEAADAGVRGFSTGLIYAPGSYAGADEIRALVRFAASRGMLYSTHMRDEGDGLLDSVAESIAAIGGTGRLEISHIKATGIENHGRVPDALAAIDAARARGVDVAADVYPYSASSTTLTSQLPGWALDRGRAALPERIADPREREAMLAELRTHLRTVTRPELIVICALSPEGPGGWEWALGLDLAEIAERAAVEPAEAALDMLAAHAGAVGMIHHSMVEEDVRSALAHPHVSVASDGHLMALEGPGRPHPRNFGTFVRVLRKYVREEELLTVEEAVRKMTTLPASRLGLHDRGAIAVGRRADIAVFDPRTVADSATFEDPRQLAVGVDDVIVGGRIARAGGELRRGRGGGVV